MSTAILTRSLSPTLTLTTPEPSAFSSIFQTMKCFPEQELQTTKDSFICETQHFPFNDRSHFQIYCVVPTEDRRIDYDDFSAAVLQRRHVVSKVIQKSLEECNFEEEFQSLLQYIQEHRLTSSSKYRIIFHQEKRRWQRNAFLKRPKKNIITELQIEVESQE